MEKQKLLVLLVDDDEDEYVLLREMIKTLNAARGQVRFHLDWSASYGAALAASEQKAYDIFLVDHFLGQETGLELLREWSARGIYTPAILLTGQNSLELDLAAMQAGAVDYIYKGELTAALLERTIRYALQHRRTQEELERRVQERTRELAQANEELLAEIAAREQFEQALQESEARLRALAETTSAAILIVQDGRIRYANPAARFVTGYSPEELVQKAFWEIAHPTYQEHIRNNNVFQQWDPSVPARFELKILTAGGEEHWLDITAGEMIFEGRPASIVTAFDITERDRAEKALYQAKVELEKRVAERTSELSHANENLEHAKTQAEFLAYVSQSFARAGLDYHRVLTTAAREITETVGDGCIIRLVSPDGNWVDPVALYFKESEPDVDEAVLQNLFREHVSGNTIGRVVRTGEPLVMLNTNPEELARIFRRDTTPILERMRVHSLLVVPLRAHNEIIGTLTVLRSETSPPYTRDDLAFFQELADRTALAIENARLHLQVKQQADRDALTGQFNRGAFFELGELEMDQYQKSGRPLTAIMLDIDRFKTINDVHGHAIGDEILRRVIDYCRENIRHTDILGRYGGDEFAILLPDTDLRTAEAVARRIRASIAASAVMTTAGPVAVSISVGVAEAEAEMHQIQELLNLADQALYHAKRLGRNRVEVES